MTTTTRLWELSEVIKELESALATLQEDDTLSDEQRDAQLEQAFSQWLQAGESWRLKAEQVAAYIRHHSRANRSEEAGGQTDTHKSRNRQRTKRLG